MGTKVQFFATKVQLLVAHSSYIALPKKLCQSVYILIFQVIKTENYQQIKHKIMKKILIIILIAFVGHHTLQAQFGKKLSQMIGGKETPVADQYSFNFKIAYQMTTEHKGKPSSMNFVMRFPNEGSYQSNEISEIATDKTRTKGVSFEMVTVLDYSNAAIIMFMEENKLAQIFPMDDLMLTPSTSGESSVNMVKTGNTKEILGYSSDEYTMDTDDMSGTFWVTTELAIDYEGYVKGINKAFSRGKKNNFKIPEGSKGLMMEMDMTLKSKKGGKMQMKVTELNEEEVTFTMADYQVANGGVMAGFGSK